MPDLRRIYDPVWWWRLGMQWYVIFGDSDNAEELLKGGKNVAFVAADDVDWEG